MNSNELPLRDIHLPPPVSWWPPAPGWWVLPLLAALLTIAGLWWWRRRMAQRFAPATLARAELAKLQSTWQTQHDPQQLLRDISIWLRRASMALASRRAVASLTGAAWQHQLAELAGEPVFSAAESRLITEVSYRERLPEGVVVDGEHLLALCERWLDATQRRQAHK